MEMDEPAGLRLRDRNGKSSSSLLAACGGGNRLPSPCPLADLLPPQGYWTLGLSGCPFWLVVMFALHVWVSVCVAAVCMVCFLPVHMHTPGLFPHSPVSSVAIVRMEFPVWSAWQRWAHTRQTLTTNWALCRTNPQLPQVSALWALGAFQTLAKSLRNNGFLASYSYLTNIFANVGDWGSCVI